MWGGGGRAVSCACLPACFASSLLVRSPPPPPQPSVQTEGQATTTARRRFLPVLSRGFVRNLASLVRTVLSAKPRFPRISAQLCSSDAFSARLWPIEAPVRRKPQTKFPDRGSSVLRLPLNQSHP